MRFEWDEAKNRQNLGKHGIGFETAGLVFEDPHALSFQDRVVEGEERWRTFGAVYGRIVMVAHTGMKKKARMLSVSSQLDVRLPMKRGFMKLTKSQAKTDSRTETHEG